MEYSVKEKLTYTFIICFLMEFLMAYYNYFFHTDAFLDEAFLLACVEFIPAFIVGLICEWFIISRVAKRVAKYLHAKHFARRDIRRINEFFIAFGMVIVVSIFGVIYHANSTPHSLFVTLLYDIFKNGIFGIPLFMFIVSPLAHKITTRMVTKVTINSINQ